MDDLVVVSSCEEQDGHEELDLWKTESNSLYVYTYLAK